MKKIHALLGVIALTLVFFFSGVINASANEFKFSVKAIPSSKQINKEATYFDLALNPNDKETLQVELGNSTDKDVVVDLSFNTAKTNGSGVVEYRPNKLKSSNTLPFDLSKYIEFPKQVTIPKHGSKKVDFKVSMPDKSFDGILASGIQFREHGQEEKNKGKNSALAINNTFSYVLAFLIQQGKTDIAPKIVSNKATLETQQGRSTVLLNLENVKSSYLNKMAIDVDVYHDNDKESVTGIIKKDMQFAPNSIMDFRIGLGNKEVKPGKYTVKGTLYGDKSTLGTYEYKGEKYKYKLDINESFDVSGEKAQKLNKDNVLIPKKENNKIWIYIIIGLIILLILAVGIIIYILRKNKKKELNEK